MSWNWTSIVIVKKIKNPKKSSSKHIRIVRLVKYIMQPERENSLEKCVHFGSRGFLTDDTASQIVEMVSLSQDAVRSKDTINHYVLSWQEGEIPTTVQIDEAVTIFVEELGLAKHQVFYGLHADTDNIHLHVAINRVCPETTRCVEINRGFDIESAHRAIARIESIQGWRREINGRYVVLENGDLGREHLHNASPALPSNIVDKEYVQGEKSALTLAIEQATPILASATSWNEVHQRLLPFGIRYERHGSGAKIFVGDVAVKASDVNRNFSLLKMQQRLGVYHPLLEKSVESIIHKPHPVLPPPSRRANNGLHELSKCRLAYHGNASTARVLSIDVCPHRRKAKSLRRRNSIKHDASLIPVVTGSASWSIYISQRAEYLQQRRSALYEVSQSYFDELRLLKQRHYERRSELFRSNWRGRGAELNIVRSLLAAEQAAELANLKDKLRKRRRALSVQFPLFPSYEQWFTQSSQSEANQEGPYRYVEPQAMEGELDSLLFKDIRSFHHFVSGSRVYYSRDPEPTSSDLNASFVDTGRKLEIADWRDKDVILAAMQLSAQKWGTIHLNGCDEYKRLCIEVAVEHGFKISNEELQREIEAEIDRVKTQKILSRTARERTAFEVYSAAVGADRYRVTSVKMFASGDRRAFVLDKRDGVSVGFSPDELVNKLEEMQRLQQRGENLYYTPLSDDKHHILIDDMSSEKLAQFKVDGFHPAVVLESSPGNFQAIVTIPKLMTEHDREVGNRLSRLLNARYGDANLSGAVHPHRAPGFENRKLKHRANDGSYPLVHLLESNSGICNKAHALSRQFGQELRETSAIAIEHTKGESSADKALSSASGVSLAYHLHYRDILKRLKPKGAPVDLSRIDSMIAVRLRVSGHDAAEIEQTILQCAPLIRPNAEGRDWVDYARRTVRYAFGFAGDRQAQSLEKYRVQWVNLEQEHGAGGPNDSRPGPVLGES